MIITEERRDLSVGLGNSLQLILLLDGVTVAASLGGVDQLISQALGDGLDVSEGGLASSGAEKPDSLETRESNTKVHFFSFVYLVDSSERRHIHSLSSDSSSATNTSGVFSGSRVDDGVDQDLERVLTSQQVDDLEAVLHDPHSQQLLTVVSSVHHEAVHQTLNDGALSLPEPLGGVSKKYFMMIRLQTNLK